jgi:hypothetical protein
MYIYIKFIPHASQFSISDRIPEIITLVGGKIYLFWLRVSDSVHSPLALLLWVCGSTVHNSGSTWQRMPIHLMEAERQRERKGKRLVFQYPLQGHIRAT